MPSRRCSPPPADHVRGAGTSIAGNAVGPGLVLDLGRHLHRILGLDPEARTASVEPGVVCARLQRAAAGHGLRFGPDPSTHDRCTVGGMVGNNACGTRTLAYGRTADNVVALDVLTGSGERLRLGPDAAQAAERAPADPSAVLGPLRAVVDGSLGTIRTEFGRFGRQVSGYGLEHLLPENRFDVARFLAGSEGTLAVITGATLRLVEDAPYKIMIALGYPTMADAADAAPLIVDHRPTACEGLDRRIVDVVRHTRGGAAVPALPRGDGWMFVELVDLTADCQTHGRQPETIVRLVECRGRLGFDALRGCPCLRKPVRERHRDAGRVRRGGSEHGSNDEYTQSAQQTFGRTGGRARA